jgi:hypothetical protein
MKHEIRPFDYSPWVTVDTDANHFGNVQGPWVSINISLGRDVWRCRVTKTWVASDGGWREASIDVHSMQVAPDGYEGPTRKDVVVNALTLAERLDALLPRNTEDLTDNTISAVLRQLKADGWTDGTVIKSP